MKYQRMRMRWTALLLAVLTVVLPASRAAAQDVRTLATKVADILAQFPAAAGPARDLLAGQMIALGEPGIAEFTRQLAPAASGNDTAVRFALNGMAAWAGRAVPTDRKRVVAERALAGALAGASDPEVRAFLMSQLQLVGTDASVKAAAPYLADPALVEPATQLMLSVRGLAARRTMLAALGKTTGAAQITIAKALGQLKAVEAMRQLTALAAAPDVVVRKTALASLATIASPQSYKTLTDAARAADFRYDPANATGALVDYARNLAAKGNLATSERVCRLLMKSCTDVERLPTSSAALAVLAGSRGGAVTGDLLAAADHSDKAYRNAALLLAQRMPGVAVTRQWVSKAGQAGPELRAEILAMLGRRGDRAALPFVKASLAASEPQVVIAAAEALAHLVKAEAVPELLTLLAKRPADEARALGAILLWTIDEKRLDPLVSMLDTLPPSGKSAALAVIGAKSGKRFASRVFALAADADPDPEVRAAAFAALPGVVGANDMTTLLRLLDAAVEPSAIKDAQAASVVAAREIEPEPARATPLLEAMKSSAHPERILEVLPQIGGAQALAAIIDRFERGEPVVKTVAFRALVQWRGPEAAERLYAICAGGEAAYRDQAFGGFVRQISASALPADQKLLQFRKILPIASTVAERRTLLRAVERVKTFQSFLVAMSFFDDKDLANDAAGIAMRIALPTSGARDGLAGSVVREGLGRVVQILTGPESDYDKENIRNYLASMPKGDGFVPLFNGKDLSGWKGLVENPIARAKMSPQELATKQAEADKRMGTTWSVRDGTIVFNGKGDNLCTVKDYRDFEMLVDWRITKGGDSGVYLRGTPQVQIWDTARVDVGAQVGSGGLYNNQKNASKPLVVADNPVGEWNTLRITMIGDKVTVFLNGIKVVDEVTMENYWDRKQPIFPVGAIELQAHGTDLAFRDIYVREISDAEYSLTNEERTEGFVSLFNGRTLDGWIGNLAGYRIENGAMAYDPKSGDRTNLYTAKEYSDFQFRFEFQLTPGANSGVGIRAPREGDAAYVGMEVQVLDDTAPVYAKLQPYQYHGSVYGVIAARRGSQKPVGEWNSEEIMVRGSHIRVTLNGTVIVDGDLAEASRNGTIDHQKHPGLQRTGGYIGWLSHDSVVRFRNIRIKDLSPGTRP